MTSKNTINREILSLALPSMLALMAEPLMGIFDTMLIGRYGTPELAATAGVSAILSMSLWLFNFLSTGTTSRVAILFGANKTRQIGSYVSKVYITSIWIGLFLSLFFLLSGRTLLHLYGFSPDTIELARRYLLVRVIGLPVTMLLYAGIGFHRGIQDAVVPMIASVSANIVNLVLDIMLIYGIKGFIPEMGITGAAWATVIAQFSGLGILFFYGIKRNLFKRFSLTLNNRIDEYKQLFRTSGHLFLRTLFLLSSFLIAGSVAARMGSAVLASHEIAMKLWLLGSFTIDSFAVAGQALAGKYRGLKNEANIQPELLRKLLLWGVVLGVLFSAVYLLAGDHIIRFFSKDDQVIQIVYSIFFFLVGMQIPSAVTFVLDGVLIGLERTKYLMQMMAIAAFLYAGTSIASFFWDWGITGIWTGLTLLIIIRFVTNLYPFKHVLKFR